MLLIKCDLCHNPHLVWYYSPESLRTRSYWQVHCQPDFLNLIFPFGDTQVYYLGGDSVKYVSSFASLKAKMPSQDIFLGPRPWGPSPLCFFAWWERFHKGFIRYCQWKAFGLYASLTYLCCLASKKEDWLNDCHEDFNFSCGINVFGLVFIANFVKSFQSIACSDWKCLLPRQMKSSDTLSFPLQC